ELVTDHNLIGAEGDYGLFIAKPSQVAVGRIDVLNKGSRYVYDTKDLSRITTKGLKDGEAVSAQELLDATVVGEKTFDRTQALPSARIIVSGFGLKFGQFAHLEIGANALNIYEKIIQNLGVAVNEETGELRFAEETLPPFLAVDRRAEEFQLRA